MADASVSGADILKDVWVQVPSPAYYYKRSCEKSIFFTVSFLYNLRKLTRCAKYKKTSK